MAWIKLETSVSRHHKFLAAGPAASWLWVCGLAYCQEGLTDGFIPFQAVRHLGIKTPNRLVTALVRAGLWEQCDGGWRVHDYLLHHKPAAEVLGLKQERRANGAKGGHASAEKRRFTDQTPETPKQVAEASAPTGPKQTANPVQITQDRSDQQHTQVRAPIVQSAVSQRNVAHFTEIGVHVPSFLHNDEFKARLMNAEGLTDAQADKALRTWYESVEKQWTGKRIGDEAPKFWRTRFAEWQGTTVAAKPKAPTSRYQNWAPAPTGTDGKR
jgi:hypothetical protein